MMTDPVADALTRIRNALNIKREHVEMPSSSLKVSIMAVLKREGFIEGFTVIDTKPRATLRVDLKYGPSGEDVISVINRTSKPGRRLYKAVAELAPVRSGLGICVVSTPKGVLSDRECRKEKVGGEVLATVW